jgi:hypothetical protein
VKNLWYVGFVAISQLTTGCRTLEPSDSGRPKDSPKETQAITYAWENDRIDVIFVRSPQDSFWYMAVRDAWDIAEQVRNQTNKTWVCTNAGCSEERTLFIVDDSLERFRRAKPNAQLESLHVEMQIITNLWCEILRASGAAMRKLEGRWQPTVREAPLELDQAVQSALQSSLAVSGVKKALQKHGLRTEYISTSEKLLFKDSVVGLDWNTISKLPGYGIMMPGTIEFGLEKKNREQH